MRRATRSAAGKRIGIAAFICVVGAALVPQEAGAGVNRWTPIGPEGGFRCALAVAPSAPEVVYSAGTRLFRSADAGRTWEPTGAPEGSASCLLSVDAADPLRLYALRPDRVLRSVDGGTSWETILAGISAAIAPIYPVAVSPADPDFLLFSSYNQVFRSRDRGDTWQEVWDIPDLWVGNLAIDPIVPGRAYALTRYRGIYVSEDFGDTWTVLADGFGNGTVHETLHFDPQDPSTFFLVTRFGIWRSRDRGAIWARVLPPSTMFAAPGFAILPDSTLFSLQTETGRKFLLRSRDGGGSWQDLGSPFPATPDAGFMGFVAVKSELLLTGAGMLRSSDLGVSWQESNAGLLATDTFDLELDREHPERLFGLPQQNGYHPVGIQRSLNRGESWHQVPLSEEGADARLVDFIVDPGDPLRYYVVTDLGYATGNGFRGLFASQDAGESWIAHPGPFDGLVLTELEIDRLQRARLYLSGRFEHETVPPDCYNWRSEDSGESWNCVGVDGNADILRGVAPSPFEAGVVLALGAEGLYRSTNAGESWRVVAEPPLFTPQYDSSVVWASPETAYATAPPSAGPQESGLFVSDDAGLTWHRTLPSPDNVDGRPWLTSLAVDPFRPGTIFGLSKAASDVDPREVVRSSDGGLTWFALSQGLDGLPIYSLEIDPVTPNRLYVSLSGGGVWAYDHQQPEPCVPSATALCITDGRFRIESIWRDFAGNSGVGHAVPLAADTGAFWFFDPDNLELFAKEIDGVGYNNAFWTFYGALSNVEFTLLATDTATGAQHGYFNPSRRFASQGDIESFPQEESLVSPMSFAVAPVAPRRPRPAPQRSANACVPNSTTLCLADGRFAASVTWRDFAGRSGVGTPLVLTPDTGSFWFFDAGIHELAVKVIDGRGTNDAFWVFYGSLSNVEFELTVIDTETGDTWTRANPSGTFASGGDIGAFPQELP
ncbi:MAG: hypothetical protein QG573_1973 [Acidobacteriota bacterium]|nr:hypothetical protein [Acidobacteriota bacterium]